MHGAWSFVGRTAEFTRLVDSAAETGRRGLVFGGAAGIGKSRLLREGVSELGRGRCAVLTATATAATAGLPFGGLAHVLPTDQPIGLSPAGLLRWAVDALRQQTGPQAFVLAVDDAHLLDPISAALISYVVQSGQGRLLATVRSGEPAPDPVRSLWTGGFVDRIDLGPLTEPDTADLLKTVLGGDVDPSTVRRLWRLSEGNVLLLRELVLAAHTAGEIVEEHGVWRWTGRLELVPSLTEVIDARIGGLDPDVRTAVEYVAFGEPIGLSLLGWAGVGEALERAEERQLVRVVGEGRRSTVRLAHPLYGEVARQRCPATRARRVLAELAGLVERAGARRGDDLLRVATWQLDSGTARAPGVLLKASGQAFAAYDMPLALRLGHAAVSAGGGFDAAESLATLLMFADRPAEAVPILDRAAPLIATDDQRARWFVARGISTYWGLADPSAAAPMPAAAAGAVDPANRARIQAIEAMMRLHHNEPERLAELAADIAANPDARPGDRALVRCAVGHLQAARGRPVRTLREMVAVEAGSAQWLAETPYFQLAVELARGTAMIVGVDLATLDAVIAAEYADMVDAGDFHMGSGHLAVVRAQAARLRGELGEAVRFARTARARLIAGRIFGGLACAELAHAAALTGDTQTATAALAEADQLHRPTVAIFYPYLELARAWTRVASGDRVGALAVLRRLLGRLRADNFTGYEVFALHDMVRLGEPAGTVERLGELAGEVEGAYAPVAARHAEAAARADVAGLLDAAAELAGIGLYLHAAEAATAAVQAGRESRSGLVAEAAGRRADYLAACENGHTPGLVLTQPALTDRERQIARRAAEGASSKQIADELFLFRRTVDNHLLRVYAKLGVGGRAELATALRTVT